MTLVPPDVAPAHGGFGLPMADPTPPGFAERTRLMIVRLLAPPPTGLVGDALRLVRSPEPIRIERPTQGWVWVIPPFLFDVATPELRLDWEHDAYRWADPTELTSDDCVSSLTRVWTLLDDSAAAQTA